MFPIGFFALSFLISVSAFSGTSTFPWSLNFWFSFWIYRQSHRCRNHCFFDQIYECNLYTNLRWIRAFLLLSRGMMFPIGFLPFLHFRFWYPFRHVQEHPLFRDHQHFDFHFRFISKATVVEIIVFGSNLRMQFVYKSPNKNQILDDHRKVDVPENAETDIENESAILARSR